MKTGDYVICIKNLEIGDKLIFIKNEQYKIRNIEEDGYTSIFKYNHKFKAYIYYGFELYQKKSNRYFHNFFITTQKIRKLKLDKINGSNL